jgi:transcription antitermination factor NusG
MPRYSSILSVTDADGKTFLPISASEEVFLNTILVDGMMRVSYVSVYRDHKVVEAIGPLEHYVDKIVDMNLHHRRAKAKIPLTGEERRIKFGLWLENDPELELIEEEKRLRKKKEREACFKAGDMVINTKGVFGDTPMEVKEVNPDKNSLTVKIPLFGRSTDTEMSMDDVVIWRAGAG